MTVTSPKLADWHNPDSYAVADPSSYGSWLFPVIYEVEMLLPDTDPVFDGSGLIPGSGFDLLVTELHASPHKSTAEWKNVPPEDFRTPPSGGGDPIPEPLTMLGMFLGLGTVGGYIRRRQRR